MRGDDLQVCNLPATIPVLVLDADIRELDVFVLVWQPVRQRPFPNLIGRPIGPTVAVPFLAIALLEETLIVAFQLVVEDDPPDVTTALSDRLRRSLVRLVKVRVVGDLGPPGEARVEALAIVERAVLGSIEQVATALRESHKSGPGTSSAKRTGFDEARTPQVLNLSIAASTCAIVRQLHITSRHGAKRTDRRQQPHVGAG